VVWLGNVGDEGSASVSSRSGGNDDVVGGTTRAVGGDEDRIPGASLLSKLQ
jgi:hypothetical protein